MKRISALLTIIIITTLLMLPVSANSAEPPSFTLLVTGAPDDLTVSIETADGHTAALKKTVVGWETYFKFFYSDLPESVGHELDGIALLFESGGVIGRQPLPSDALTTYNNLLTFDWEKQTLIVGQPALRVPLLVAMRIALTFIIEGIVFFAFGYRHRRSWLIFAAVNLVTQTLLNISITGPVLLGYWIIGFWFAEAIIFICEALLFRFLLTEHKSRAVLCAISANAASLILGMLVLTYLPV